MRSDIECGCAVIVMLERIQVVDSHTGGEPTRVVIAGGPDLGTGNLVVRRRIFQERFDHYRSAIVNEPRGSDVLVGALLVPPTDPACVAAVIFFNNVGVLHMCGHGTIGLAATLGYLGRIQAGRHLLETPVGVIPFTYDGKQQTTLQNVPSFRHRKNVILAGEGIGLVSGDVAWGGNWFFLVAGQTETIDVANAERLTDYTWRIRQALEKQGITGANGGHIDHVEVFGPPRDPRNHSRNFVLCPGKAYDRSPCGTGTSAKLACLYEDGKLQPGQVWRQESILGSVFEGTVAVQDGQVIPSITGTASVTAEATLLIDPDDPLTYGIRA